MNSQQNFLNVQSDDGYIFPPNVEQQIQQQNMQYQVSNQIYPPQVEYQTIQQVYQPNIVYAMNQQANQSNTEYQANDQFYQSNADVNTERKPSTSLPPKEKRKRNRTTYTDEQIKQLEEHFKEYHFITPKQKKELAEALQLEEKQVRKWYQNRRTKERATQKANCRQGTENQRLPPSQLIGHVQGNDHRINLNSMNPFQYNTYPEARSREVLLNVDRTQNLGEQKEGNHSREPQNFNNYYAYNNPNVYGNNLMQIPGIILPTPLENFHPAPLQENNQNIINNYYYGNNRNENLTQNLSLIAYPQLENLNPLQFQEDHQNIFKDDVLPYNEHEQN